MLSGIKFAIPMIDDVSHNLNLLQQMNRKQKIGAYNGPVVSSFTLQKGSEIEKSQRHQGWTLTFIIIILLCVNKKFLVNFNNFVLCPYESHLLLVKTIMQYF